MKFRRVLITIKRIAVGLFQHHAFDHAAAMSFYFFLGMIPLLVFAGLLLGELVHKRGIDELVGPILQVVPKGASKLLRNELGTIGNARLTSIAPLSLVGFLWLTSSGIHNLMDVFETVAKAPPRGWWKQRGLAIVGIAIVLMTVAGVTSVLMWVNSLVPNDIEDDSGLILRVFNQFQTFLADGWNLLGAFIILIGLAVCGLALFYRVGVSHPRGIRRRIWPGAILGLTSWFAVSWGFGAYVRTLGQYAVYYGSLATVAVLLLWFYLTSLSLLIGAELNAQLEGIRSPSDKQTGRDSFHTEVDL